MLTLDTNILIGYLGGEEKIIAQIKEWRRNGAVLFVSSITECELLSYPKLTAGEKEKIENFLKENFVLMPFDSLLARYAAAIRRTVTSLKLPDAAIVALALKMGAGLVTRNARDFRKIPDLSLLII